MIVVPHPVRSNTVYEALNVLTDEFTVISYEPLTSPGTGRITSSALVDALVSQLEEVQDAVGADKAILAAHSAAGWTAIRYAALHADRVAGLLLLSASNSIRPIPAYVSQNEDSHEHLAAAHRIACQFGTAPAIVMTAVSQFVDVQLAVSVLSDARVFGPAALNHSNAATLSADETSNLTPAFRESTVPTALIVGGLEIGDITRSEIAEEYELPRSTEVHVVPDAGHFAWLEESRQLDLVRTTVRRLWDAGLAPTY